MTTVPCTPQLLTPARTQRRNIAARARNPSDDPENNPLVPRQVLTASRPPPKSLMPSKPLLV
jgi:hypothetical protein